MFRCNENRQQMVYIRKRVYPCDCVSLGVQSNVTPSRLIQDRRMMFANPFCVNVVAPPVHFSALLHLTMDDIVDQPV